MKSIQAYGETDAVPVGVLLFTVFESIIEVFILCLAGYILARTGILDKPTQRKLNVVNVSLMTPALLFSKVAFSLTPEKLKEMWIIPLGFVIVTFVSAGVAWGLGTVFRLKRSQRSFAMCASMFQNSNSLPIALIQSLVVEVPGLKWGNDDTKDAMLGRALAYLVVYSTLGMMLRWSYGVKLLSAADEDQPEIPTSAVTSTVLTAEPETLDQPGTEHNGPHVGARETDPFFSSQDRLKADEEEEDAAAAEARRVSASSSTFAWRTGPGTPTLNGGGSEPISAHTLQTQNGIANGHTDTGSPNPNPNASGISASSIPRRLTSGRQRNGSFPVRRPSQMSRTESGREFWGLPEAGKSRTDLTKLGMGERLSDQDEESEGSSGEESDEEWGDRTLPFTRRRQFQTPPHTRFGSLLRKFRTKITSFLQKLNEFLTVPMYSALLSIFIALIPPLQVQLNRAKPLTLAIKSAGQCSIPLTLVVLGAFFYTPPDPNAKTPPPLDHTKPFLQRHYDAFKAKHQPVKSKSQGGSGIVRPGSAHPGENKTVFVAVISRMFLVPLVLLPPVALIARYDLFEAAEDPVFILAATLIISSPPALTLAQITQAASGDAFERLISKTITWSYAILTPPLTLAYVVLGLVFGRL